MLRVFYGQQVYGEYSNWAEWTCQRRAGLISDEVYNGAYAYVANHKYVLWFRADGTPCLIEDVPKQLLALQLILGNST